MHVLEQYFSNTKRTDTSDYMSLGVIRSVIENTNRYKDGENTYEVRANLSWASTIGLNWILGVDKIGDWATHRLSYVLTKEYDITHGYALAMLFTSWARVALKYNKETMERRLSRLGEFLFYEKDANKVLDKLDDLFKSFNASVRISDQLTLSDETIKDLVDNALELGSVGTVITVDHEKATEIFKLACEVTL
jgi:alcohol dehydrogenase YqhD (iron-dependent ADH family)